MQTLGAADFSPAPAKQLKQLLVAPLIHVAQVRSHALHADPAASKYNSLEHTQAAGLVPASLKEGKQERHWVGSADRQEAHLESQGVQLVGSMEYPVGHLQVWEAVRTAVERQEAHCSAVDVQMRH